MNSGSGSGCMLSAVISGTGAGGGEGKEEATFVL